MGGAYLATLIERERRLEGEKALAATNRLRQTDQNRSSLTLGMIVDATIIYNHIMSINHRWRFTNLLSPNPSHFKSIFGNNPSPNVNCAIKKICSSLTSTLPLDIQSYYNLQIDNLRNDQKLTVILYNIGHGEALALENDHLVIHAPSRFNQRGRDQFLDQMRQIGFEIGIQQPQ